MLLSSKHGDELVAIADCILCLSVVFVCFGKIY